MPCVRNRPDRSGRCLYRSRNGVILGVCRGLALYFDARVIWIRMFAVLLLLFTGLWPAIGLYLLAGILMKPEPVLPFANTAEQEFYNSYTGSRGMALQRLKRKFDNMDRRIQRMEHIVTSKDFDWERRFKSQS